MQLGLGYNFSTASNAPLRPRVADLNAALRYGWMLNSPGGTGFLRGNCEFIVEAVAGGATDGPGGVIIGGTLIFRYNFIQPSSRWIPYVQAGIGAVYNDIYRQHPQRVIGQSVEFTVQGEIGLRYQLNPHTALYAEAGYRHISNAGLADRNYGLNSLAVQVGMSWLW
ncbi:MAG: acyloxyacyl hydrolase [Chthoniobacteraceae bacterium]